MIPLRTAALYSAGLLAAFAAGWFLKPAPAPKHAGQSADGASRRIAPPTSLAGRPFGTARGTWLDAANADAAGMHGAARAGEVNQVLVEKLGAVLDVLDPVERLARWSALLPLMRTEDAEGIRAKLLLNRVEGRHFPEETTAFWRRCGLVDPVTALAWAAQEKGGGARSDVLGGWARRDSAAALAWLRANPDQPDPELGFETEPGISISGLMKGLVAQSPAAAVELLLANAGDPLFSSCQGMAADIIIQHQGITAARQWFLEVAGSDAPAAFKTAILERLFSCRNLPSDNFGISRRMERSQTAALVEYAGEPWFPKSAASDLGVYMGRLDPEGGAVVMESFQDAGAKKCFMNTFLWHWLAKDAAAVGEWLRVNRASSSFDGVAFSLAGYLSAEDPEAARGWAAQISNPVLREEMERALSKDWESAPNGAFVDK